MLNGRPMGLSHCDSVIVRQPRGERVKHLTAISVKEISICHLFSKKAGATCWLSAYVSGLKGGNRVTRNELFNKNTRIFSSHLRVLCEW